MPDVAKPSPAERDREMADMDAEDRPGSPKAAVPGLLGGRFVWPLLCIFLLGLAAGLYRVSSRTVVVVRPADARPMDRPHKDDPSESQSHASSPHPAVGVPQADELLRQGRYDEALAAYRPVTPTATGMPDSLRYRAALCLEGLGRWDEALGEYALITSRGADASGTSAAQLGQARIWLRLKRPAEAKGLLCDLILKSAQPGLQHSPFLDDSIHWLALTLSTEALGPGEPGPLHDSVVARSTPDARPEEFLDWITPAESHPRPAVGVEADQLVVHRRGPTLEELDVTAALRTGPVLELLECLAREAGLKCQWGAQAREQITGRFASLSVEHLPLPVVLTALTQALGLLWEANDGAVHFSREQELVAEALAASRGQLAERLLNHAVSGYPKSRLTAAAYAELGNLAFARGEPSEAIAWYQRLTAEFPRSPLTANANYNLGLVHRVSQDFTAARASFYSVVDGSPAHVLAPLAYLVIGRMYLEEGDTERAIAPLRRAASAASSTGHRAAAAIALATSFMLADSPRAASTVLLEHRQAVAEPPYRSAAAFLGMYARYRAAADRSQAQQEARLLIWSVLAVSRDPVLGPSGVLLMGRTYRDLGLNELMAATYQKAIQEGHAKLLVPEMLYDLADFSLATGKRELAIEQFSALGAKGSGPWSHRAQLRLAEIALDERRTDDCLAQCRKLLNQADPPDAPPILSLMGRAFEQVGNHRHAALCFAGQAPSP